MKPTVLFLLLLSVANVAKAQPSNATEIPNPAPDAEQAAFVIPEGFELNLWASEPLLRKPVQMNWDAQGRLWVVSSSTYPQIKPGDDVVDQVIVLEDTDHDGKADKSTIFANDLHIPTAVMPADGGCYVANSTEILFLKDTDGDGKADTRQIILSGFGTEDTHHLLHTFRFGPEGMLHFNQSIYIHSHVETPWGVRRLMGGGIWEFRPETRKLEVIAKGLVNPWGYEYDRWGQSFATDGAGSEGINYIFPGAVFLTSPGAKRIISGMNPGQPKHCGLEIIEEPHFPDDWQGTFVTCDFRGNRINRFQLAESGSGYVSKQLPDVLASTHRGFRPIDVRTGPDGALYIADWYNPIIQHGEVDFRDPRRDHTNGRIWRLTAKGRPLSENPNFAKMDTVMLANQLESDRRWNRLFAKLEMKNRPLVPVKEALRMGGQFPDKAKSQRMQLELAWAHEVINDYEPYSIRMTQMSDDHRVRAGGLRILSQHVNDTPEAMQLLAKAVTDEHPQVRLWAIACLQLMAKPEAVEIALRALDKPMDNNLDFLLEELCRDQADMWLPVFLKGDLKLNENPRHLVYALKATGKVEALPPLLAALASGRLAPEDAAAVLAVAGDVADPEQLDQLLTLAFDDKLQAQRAGMLDALVKAAQRKVIPTANATDAVTKLLASNDVEISKRGALLAGLWKQENTRGQLAKWASQADGAPALREAAVRGLTYLGGEPTRLLFEQLTSADQSVATRILAINGISEMAPALGAKKAAEFLTTIKTADEAKPVIEAFIKNKTLPNLLAKELAGKTIPEAAAVEGIRMVSTRGVKGGLEEALHKSGNIKQMDKPLTPKEMQALVARVKTEGDPARGELVYRRQLLLCASCHAIGESGGLIGPNLVSIGGSAPVDYLIESLLEPSKKIKEGYHMTMITMKDGQVVAGAIAQDSGEDMVIRDAANQLHKVAKSQIAQKQISPVSMMPPGMTASLRQDEFLDLVRFLSELGREGDYKIKPNRYIRTWRTMGKMEQPDVDHVRHVGLESLSDRAYAYPWTIAYSQVSGALPLAELSVAAKMYPWFPKIVQADLQLDTDGTITLGLPAIKGVILVVDDKKYDELTPEMKLNLKAGKHVVSLLVTREAGDVKDLRVEILDGAASVITGL